MRLVAQERLHGVEVRFVPTDTEEICAAATARGSIWIETPSNPTLDVCDIAPWPSPRTRRARCWRSTTRSPRRSASSRLALGADISMMSGTKTLCGHSDVLLGAVSVRDDALLDALRRWRSQSGSIVGAFEAWLAAPLAGHAGAAARTLERRRAGRGARAARARRRPRGRASLRPRGRVAPDAQLRLPGRVHARERGPRAGVLDACELVAEATSFGGVHATAERRERWGTDAVPRAASSATPPASRTPRTSSPTCCGPLNA